MVKNDIDIITSHNLLEFDPTEIPSDKSPVLSTIIAGDPQLSALKPVVVVEKLNAKDIQRWTTCENSSVEPILPMAKVADRSMKRKPFEVKISSKPKSPRLSKTKTTAKPQGNSSVLNGGTLGEIQSQLESDDGGYVAPTVRKSTVEVEPDVSNLANKRITQRNVLVPQPIMPSSVQLESEYIEGDQTGHNDIYVPLCLRGISSVVESPLEDLPYPDINSFTSTIITPPELPTTASTSAAKLKPVKTVRFAIQTKSLKRKKAAKSITEAPSNQDVSGDSDTDAEESSSKRKSLRTGDSETFNKSLRLRKAATVVTEVSSKHHRSGETNESSLVKDQSAGQKVLKTVASMRPKRTLTRSKVAKVVTEAPSNQHESGESESDVEETPWFNKPSPKRKVLETRSSATPQRTLTRNKAVKSITEVPSNQHQSVESDTDVAECGWVKDQFGAKLIGEGQQFKLKPPQPDPDYNPTTHSPMSTFQYFFDRDYWQHIADLSNNYQKQKLADSQYDKQISNWKEKGKKGPKPTKPTEVEKRKLLTPDRVITAEEVETYVGMLLYMSILKLPKYRMYWEGKTRVNQIASRMSRNKFNLIRSHLQVVDMEDLSLYQMNRDPLANVSPMLKRFQKKCEALPRTGSLRIGETFLTDKADVSETQKPMKSGVKIFTLRSQSGLIQDFRWYSGKSAAEATETESSAIAVVKDLISSLPRHQFYRITMDNRFSSVKLFKYLRANGFCATGTLNESRLDTARKLFKSDEQMLKDRGSLEGITQRDGSVYICRWSDSHKVVTVASTHITALPSVRVTRTIGSKEIPTERPNCIDYYNRSCKGSNDMSDMLVELCHHKHNSSHSHMNIVYWIIGAAATNSWLLEQRWKLMIDEQNFKNGISAPKCVEVSLLNYTLDLAEELMVLSKVPYLQLNIFSQPPILKLAAVPFDSSTVERKERKGLKAAPVPLPTDAIRLDGVCHFGQYNQEKTSAGKAREGEKRRQRRCGNPICPAKNVGKTTFKCEKCGIFLCQQQGRNCFYQFHHTPQLSIPETNADGKPSRKGRIGLKKQSVIRGPPVNPEAILDGSESSLPSTSSFRPLKVARKDYEDSSSEDESGEETDSENEDD